MLPRTDHLAEGFGALKRIVNPYRVIFPTPAALVTSIDANGKPNVATAGEVFMMSLHPLIVAAGFRPATYTNKLIHATKEFVVNLPTQGIMEAVDYCGSVSGREVDKFEATGLTPLPAKHVKPPLIKECPVNVECQVREIIRLGSHDVFAGDVLAIHLDEEIIGDDGLPDWENLKTFAFASRKYYSVSHFLGRMGFSKKDKKP
ncbi:MAG: flavin reductase family protein [Candidatus Bathyarchaeota archaeon]|nr:flavin reductase family protein [Candidatus Bathyarchaeota archaeon]